MRLRFRTGVAIAFVAACVTVPGVGAQAETADNAGPWSFAIEAGMRYEDNIGLSGDAVSTREWITDDLFDDFTTRIAGTVNYAVLQDSGQELVLSATPFYERVEDLDALSNYGIKVAAAYRGEFGPEFTDPWYSASLGYTLIEFDDSDVREGGFLELELALGKRFSPQFGVSGGFRYFDRSQDNSSGLCPLSPTGECPGPSTANPWSADEVFEQDKWGLFAHADWFVGDNTSFFVEYSYWDGDEASSGSFRARFLSQGNGFDTLADDTTAFGFWCAAANAGCPNRVWRVQAKQHIVELGVTRMLTDKISVDLTVIHLETSDVSSEDRIGDRSLDNYRNDAVELRVNFAF